MNIKHTNTFRVIDSRRQIHDLEEHTEFIAWRTLDGKFGENKGLKQYYSLGQRATPVSDTQYQLTDGTILTKL